MTDAAAGLTRLLPGRLPLSMSLSLVTHALAALVVGVTYTVQLTATLTLTSQDRIYTTQVRVVDAVL